MSAVRHLSWLGIVRLGLVQTALGAIVVLTTSTLNRVMVVELALAASLPAALVAWHYVIQLSRPLWGHRSDRGGRRSPWIIGGMGVLALGALLATQAVLLMGSSVFWGTALGVLAFMLIGFGVGASGTSLLALLATAAAPSRRPAAASITWIMMILGIVLTAGIAGQMLDPFSAERLITVAAAICAAAFLLTIIAVAGLENGLTLPAGDQSSSAISFRSVLRETWGEKRARDFTIFVFMSMLAYSMQDLILEPFAGLVFGFTVGESTQLTGVQNGGVLLGMILVGLSGVVIKGDKTRWLRRLTAFGCLASGGVLVLIAMTGQGALALPLHPIVFALGFANGVFAVSAIGMMMSFAGGSSAHGEAQAREGIRMGLWGAAQAIAFGLGGLIGAASLDVMRLLAPDDASAFATVFSIEALVFVAAGLLAMRLGLPAANTQRPTIPPHLATEIGS